MPDPTIAHTEAIHLTTTSGATLSDSNKLEESSAVNLDISNTVTERKNLNSDGWTKNGVTWHDASGSLEFRVIRGSTIHNSIISAVVAGTNLFVHVIHTPDAATGTEKGTRYEIVPETLGRAYNSGEYVNGSFSFKTSGAPVSILAA
jgi:hypothetical protein